VGKDSFEEAVPCPCGPLPKSQNEHLLLWLPNVEKVGTGCSTDFF